jgi:hypothetical protein
VLASLRNLNDTSYAVLDPEEYFAAVRAGNSLSFSQKHSQRECFCEKDQKVPCCRRRICRPSGEMPGLYAHRVTCVNVKTWMDSSCVLVAKVVEFDQ